MGGGGLGKPKIELMIPGERSVFFALDALLSEGSSTIRMVGVWEESCRGLRLVV